LGGGDGGFRESLKTVALIPSDPIQEGGNRY
jgi:hypothetical protein